MPASLDALPTVEAELAALRRLLDFGEGHFSSSIAICNSPVERDRLIEQIRTTHPGVAVITIPPRTVDVFGHAIEGYTAPPKALFLIGLEASVTSPEADSHTLRSLNASRDLWPNRYPCPIVLWLPEYAATALSQQARDYWRFVSHRFYFAVESPTMMPRGGTTDTDKWLNAISLSSDEKVARIAELKARIESVGNDPPPALQQHVLEWWDELATLHEFTGSLDEALRIRREEQLPVYERLGDVRSKAMTMGYIADILQDRGQADEALRIQRDEVLPACNSLGDVKGKAVTMGKIADILQDRGQTDEALRIRREEELPVYERLGDVRSKAVTMGKIAEVLQQRGQTDEALSLCYKEILPAFDSLGDVSHVARTWGCIADILQQRGRTDEALHIRREKELPVYERLGDVRSKAVTMGKIAGILAQRGQTDEALRIRREEELPVYERLGDMRELVITRLKIALILLQHPSPTDQQEGREHLLWALAEAEKHQYAQAAQMRRLVTRLLPSEPVNQNQEDVVKNI